MTTATSASSRREYDLEEYIAAIRELQAAGENDQYGGVATIVIADHLDLARSTVVKNLRWLLKDGKLETTIGVGPYGPRRTYVIPGDLDE